MDGGGELKEEEVGERDGDGEGDGEEEWKLDPGVNARISILPEEPE